MIKLKVCLSRYSMLVLLITGILSACNSVPSGRDAKIEAQNVTQNKGYEGPNEIREIVIYGQKANSKGKPADGLNDMGKLSKLPSTTVTNDSSPPIYYLRENEPEEYTHEIKQKYNKSTIIPKKWHGVYHVITKESKDWRENQSIYLSISKDSIIYEIAGYQMYEKYLLKGKVINSNILSLTYLKYLDGIESAVLEKTKDFGKIYFDGKKYLWKSPYLDFYYHKKRYRLKKSKL